MASYFETDEEAYYGKTVRRPDGRETTMTGYGPQGTAPAGAYITMRSCMGPLRDGPESENSYRRKMRSVFVANLTGPAPSMAIPLPNLKTARYHICITSTSGAKGNFIKYAQVRQDIGDATRYDLSVAANGDVVGTVRVPSSVIERLLEGTQRWLAIWDGHMPHRRTLLTLVLAERRRKQTPRLPVELLQYIATEFLDQS